MPQGINGRSDAGINTPLATTTQGSPQPAGGGRRAPSAKPDGLAARDPSASASMAPRQRTSQAAARDVAAQPWVPMGQAHGVPAYPQPCMASHVAVPPPVLPPGQPTEGTFGGGGIMQMVRSAFQQIMEFPQQLHQLAHQAGHYPSSLLQQALNTARMASQDLLSARPPGVLMPSPPLHLAREFSAGAQSFDATSLGRQLVQLEQQVQQRLQDHLALMRQSLHVFAVDSQRLSVGALAGASTGAMPAKMHQD